MIRLEISRSPSRSSSRYSPPPALAIVASDARSSDEWIGGSRGDVSFGLRCGSGNEVRRPSCRRRPRRPGRRWCARSSATRATSPLHAWPSVTSTNALAFGDLPYSSLSFSISRMPHAMPSSMLVSQRGVVLEAERRLLREVIEEEEEGVRILASAAPAARRCARTAPSPCGRPSTRATRRGRAGTASTAASDRRRRPACASTPSRPAG